MGEPISRDIAELREWLVRIDTRLDYMSEVKRTADEADEKAGKALSIAEDNRQHIRDMKSNTKWLWGFFVALAGVIAPLIVVVLSK
jgi:hypothetical protein